MQVLLVRVDSSRTLQDQLTAALLSVSKAARSQLTTHFDSQPTETFRLFWCRGDLSYNAFVNATISSIGSELAATQERALVAAFQLALSYVIDAGQDHVERAVTTLSKCLAHKSPSLSTMTDYSVFEIVLPLLDIRETNDIQRAAMATTIALLGHAYDTGPTLLDTYISDKISKHRREDLIVGLSVAAAVFPLSPDTISKIILDDHFMPTLKAALDRSDSSQDKKGRALEQAVLALFNAASVDKKSRTAIQNGYRDWVDSIATRETDSAGVASATLLLVKLG